MHCAALLLDSRRRRPTVSTVVRPDDQTHALATPPTYRGLALPAAALCSQADGLTPLDDRGPVLRAKNQATRTSRPSRAQEDYRSPLAAAGLLGVVRTPADGGNRPPLSLAVAHPAGRRGGQKRALACARGGCALAGSGRLEARAFTENTVCCARWHSAEKKMMQHVGTGVRAVKKCKNRVYLLVWPGRAAWSRIQMQQEAPAVATARARLSMGPRRGARVFASLRLPPVEGSRESKLRGVEQRVWGPYNAQGPRF